MAKSNYYTPRQIVLVPGVSHKQTDARSDTYTGTAEALEEAGILRAAMLPAPGRCSTTWRPEGGRQAYGSACWEPGYMQIIAHPSGRYRVSIVVSHEEQARRRQKRASHSYCRQQSASEIKGASVARRELETLPKSHAEFRERMAGNLSRVLRAAIGEFGLLHTECGYRFDEDTVREFSASLEEALDVLRSGGSVFDAKKRAAHVAALRAKLASCDATFKPFMARLLEPVDSAEDAGAGHE